VNRIGHMDNYSSPPIVRHILNKDLSKRIFWKRTKELRQKIDNIAAQHGAVVTKHYRNTGDKNIQSRTIVDNRIDKAGSTTLTKTPDKIIQSRTIVYNRIDKAGSTTLIKTLDKMSFRNSFHLIGQGTPNVRYLFPEQKAQLADMLCASPVESLIYTRHLYYTNITMMGCQVTYFNMMRDPLDRFVSRYNYYREVWQGSKDHTNSLKFDHYVKSQGPDRSANINDCVLKKHPECDYSGKLTRWLKFFRMDSQIPFFCGDSIECRTLGNPKALEQAKKNIEQHFLMVGALESLDKSHFVMECLMPEQMQGLAEMHKKGDLHVHGEHKKTVPLSEEAGKVMRERLQPEYELYNFVQDRLERQYEQCLKSRETG